MPRRVALLLTLVVLTLCLPQTARAAFVPTCDQTVYTITDKPDGEGTESHYFQYKISPDEFEKVKGKYPTGQYQIIIDVNRKCGFDDFFQLFITLANWGLGVLALISVTLLIWGGFTLVIAGGRADYITNGKQIIIGTMTGMLVVMTAFMLINFWGFAATGSDHAFAVQGGSLTRTIFGDRLSCLNSFNERCQTNPDVNAQATFHLGCGDVATKDVASIQKALVNRRCLTSDRITGCFDEATQDAVKRFQYAGGNYAKITALRVMPDSPVGIEPVDGSVDYFTQQALNASGYDNCTST